MFSFLKRLLGTGGPTGLSLFLNGATGQPSLQSKGRSGDANWRAVMKEECSTDQIHAKYPQSFLLEIGARIVQVRVKRDLRRLLVRPGLETNADPTSTVLGTMEASRRHRIGECKETFTVAVLFAKLPRQLRELVIEHGVQPLAADVALGRAVDPIADGHVVGGDRLGDGSGGGAGLEKRAGHLLPAAYLGDGAVRSCIKVQCQRFLSRAESRAVHNRPLIRLAPPQAFGHRGNVASARVPARPCEDAR